MTNMKSQSISRCLMIYKFRQVQGIYHVPAIVESTFNINTYIVVSETPDIPFMGDDSHSSLVVFFSREGGCMLKVFPYIIVIYYDH